MSLVINCHVAHRWNIEYTRIYGIRVSLVESRPSFGGLSVSIVAFARTGFRILRQEFEPREISFKRALDQFLAQLRLVADPTSCNFVGENSLGDGDRRWFSLASLQIFTTIFADFPNLYPTIGLRNDIRRRGAFVSWTACVVFLKFTSKIPSLHVSYFELRIFHSFGEPFVLTICFSDSSLNLTLSLLRLSCSSDMFLCKFSILIAFSSSLHIGYLEEVRYVGSGIFVKSRTRLFSYIVI